MPLFGGVVNPDTLIGASDVDGLFDIAGDDTVAGGGGLGGVSREGAAAPSFEASCGSSAISWERPRRNALRSEAGDDIILIKSEVMQNSYHLLCECGFEWT